MSATGVSEAVPATPAAEPDLERSSVSAGKLLERATRAILALAQNLDLLALLPLAVFALAPLVRAPFFSSADGLLHLYRLVEFDRGIRAGELYPRWAPDLLAGYGYPIFIFYAPLVYYLGETFHLAGLGFVDALKAVVGAGMLASAVGMYVFGRHLWGRTGALLAAVAYLYMPYRLVNTYLDGELAQTLAWAWLPWLFWACWRFLETRRLRWGALAAGCYAGLIYTHSVTSWLATLFLGLTLLGLVALRRNAPGHALRLAAFLALGAGLAAPYWLPALAEQGNVQLDRVRIATYDFHSNLLPLGRTLATSLAHDYGTYVGVNGPAQLGLLQTLAGLLGLAVLLVFARRQRAMAGLFAALAAIFFILMLQPAAPFWEHLPFGRFLQFPDRLLAFVGFAFAVLAGGLGLALCRLPFAWLRPIAVALVAGGLIYGATAKLQPSYLALPASLSSADVREYEQISGAIGTSAKGEFTPRWIGAAPLASANNTPVPIAPRFSTALTELPVAYYPGWSATANGAAVPVSPSARGLVHIDGPAGATVDLHFGGTPDRQLAAALALASLASILALALRQRWPRIASLPSRPSPGASESAVVGRLFNRRAAPAGCVLAGAAVLWIVLGLMPGKLALASWPVARPMDVTYADGLSLLGSDVQVTATNLHVSVGFRPARRVQGGTRASLRLMSRDEVWASASQPFQTQGWRSGQVRKAEFDLPLAGGTPAGTYGLELDVQHADGSLVEHDLPLLAYSLPPVRLPPLGSSSLGPVTLTQPTSGGVPGQVPDNGAFGALTLRLWQPPVKAEQGQYVPFNLWWAVGQQPPQDWTLSLKVMDNQGHVWTGLDDQPRAGFNPTSLWPAGALERDVQMLLLPEGIPPGPYILQAGWLDSAGKPVGPQGVAVGSFEVVPASKPNIGHLDIPHALHQSFPGGLTLLGYDVPSTPLLAGQPLPIRLFWRADHVPDADYAVALTLNGRTETAPLPATSQWRIGQLTETRLNVPTSPAQSGSVLVSLALSRDGQTSTSEVQLPTAVSIQAPQRLTELPADLRHPDRDTLAGAVRLAGYRTSISGGALRLALYWQPLAPLPPGLLVFAHLLDAQNHVVAQHDGAPADGARPTGTWSVGEYVEDVHTIDLNAAPKGTLQLEVGLYDPATNQRLGDRLLLEPLSLG